MPAWPSLRRKPQLRLRLLGAILCALASREDFITVACLLVLTVDAASSGTRPAAPRSAAAQEGKNAPIAKPSGALEREAHDQNALPINTAYNEKTPITQSKR